MSKPRKLAVAFVGASTTAHQTRYQAIDRFYQPYVARQARPQSDPTPPFNTTTMSNDQGEYLYIIKEKHCVMIII